MSMGSVGAWASAAGLKIFLKDGAPAQQSKIKSEKAQQILRTVGKDPLALDTGKMAAAKMRSKFKDFNPEQVSPAQLGKISTFLKDNGLIDTFTSSLLLNAGEEFDKFGVQKNTDDKFNALEYFATQIATIQDRAMNRDVYSNYMVPAYKKALNVLQNLQQFGSTGAAVTVNTKA
ncbi:hypothetical protein NLK61_26100 [Pseudomonas fuscovaginae UPB0736]|uniref:Uncharacterized protein n=1 Tax=Pseudomonas asplenii TaxID=53407 RepID=A0A1H6P7S2_9PSED|nr:MULTISPECIES: hypothetical protein [Pseudomonas]UUQ64637.1 hypothetical protein NLK61_26100 [Pseudomonas fuscovaginae UPB0736]UZE26876.1 hypothetical protein LOY63_15900 [Pseudomonas asplenii]SDT11336.1 hypothetical protein SAMN05216598_4015 [Pseudomonas asplenii]SEI21324.1 hypothetical protein SAMN05216581_4454 [Pseudomonas fuscovaginae]